PVFANPRTESASKGAEVIAAGDGVLFSVLCISLCVFCASAVRVGDVQPQSRRARRGCAEKKLEIGHPPTSLLRQSKLARWGGLPVALALAHGGLLLAWPSIA